MSEMICLTGHVSKLFRNCPKPTGWTGFFFYSVQWGTIQCTMTQGGERIDAGDYLNLICEKNLSSNNTNSYVVRYAYPSPSPSDVMDILKEVRDSGNFHVSDATIKRMYSRFCLSLLDMFVYNPQKLEREFSKDFIKAVQKAVSAQSEKGQLIAAGFSEAAAEELMNKYGPDVMDVFQNDIYQIVFDFLGDRKFTFRIVDDIAVNYLKIDPNNPKRIVSGIRYAATKYIQNTGHSCINLKDQMFLSGLGKACRDTLKLWSLTDQDILFRLEHDSEFKVFDQTVGTENMRLCYPDVDYTAETCGSTFIHEMVGPSQFRFYNVDEEIEQYEVLSGVLLDDVQKEAVKQALKNQFSVITGGPGCGKTTIIACILYIWRRRFHCDSYRKPELLAPTGLAAKRMSNSVANNLSGYEYLSAHTLAMTLKGACSAHPDGNYTRTSTLIIMDETSMVGMRNAAKFLKYAKTCQVVLVGDTDQLPAIESGDFFANVCASDLIPKTTLATCYRSAGAKTVVENAHRIRNGEPLEQMQWHPNTFSFMTFPEDNIFGVDYLVKAYTDYVSRGYAYSDICILSPLRKGLMGVTHLNTILQNKLNPKVDYQPAKNGSVLIYDKKGHELHIAYGSGADATCLRVGDRVMYTVNSSELGLVNGDCGVIESYRDEGNKNAYIIVKLDDGRQVEIEELGYGSNLQLAYAVTIHKSQGQEYSHVMLALPDIYIGGEFANRNLIYTAVTRAKTSVTMAGSENFIRNCIQNVRPPRMTLLRERIDDIV